MFETVADDALLSKWRTLHAADRDVILKALQVEQREALEQMLAEEADRPETGRAREYRSYSPWLARLLADCNDDGPVRRPASEMSVTPFVVRSLTAIHAELRDHPSFIRAALPLPHRLRSFLSAWGLIA